VALCHKFRGRAVPQSRFLGLSCCRLVGVGMAGGFGMDLLDPDGLLFFFSLEGTSRRPLARCCFCLCKKIGRRRMRANFLHLVLLLRKFRRNNFSRKAPTWKRNLIRQW